MLRVVIMAYCDLSCSIGKTHDHRKIGNRASTTNVDLGEMLRIFWKRPIKDS